MQNCPQKPRGHWVRWKVTHASPLSDVICMFTGFSELQNSPRISAILTLKSIIYFRIKSDAYLELGQVTRNDLQGT